MTTFRSVILISAFLVSCSHYARGDEIRRFVDMSYVCGRDSMGRVLFSQESQKQSYEITSWSEPFTENICHKRTDLPQGCIPTELYDFSFRCGSAGSIHISEFYLNSRKGKNFGAHREGNHIVLNGGQQRVLTSHRYGDCFGRGLSLTDTSRCIEGADQYRVDQIWINLPASRAPLPDEAKLTTKVIGDDCGNGLLCNTGNKCSAGGGCVPRDSVDCGKGGWCPVGTICQASSTGAPCQRPNNPPPVAYQPPVKSPIQAPTQPASHALDNEIVALGIGTLLAIAFSVLATRVVSGVSGGGSGFWYRVRISVVAGTISNLISAPLLWHFGVISEVKLLSIPFLGVFAVALLFTPSNAS